MRLALLAPTSSDIAVLIRSRPTTSPIITRRTGLSVQQPHLLMKLASASCQNLELSGPAQKCEDRRSATHQKHDDEERSSAIKRSASAPRKNPNRPIGSRRSMVIIETRNAGALVDDNSDRNSFHPAHGSDDQADIPQEPEVRRTGLDHPPERRAASFGDGIGDLTVAQVPIPRLLSQGRG
jgi:hypothetical protein